MESAQFTIIKLEQGTPEWIEWRHKGIGASDAPIIMEENPWKSTEELLQEKRGVARNSKKNEAMRRGTMLEPEARSRYIARTGNDVKPACLQSNQYPWLRASVDGISSNGNTVVEIKCGESVYRHTSQYGCAPDYYYGQLQHILAVSGLASLDFYCYLPDCPELLIAVPRNEEYIRRLVSAERSFWNNVKPKIASVTLSADIELSNKKLTAGLLGIFLGAFGIHKFVLGYTTSGVIMLLVSVAGGVVTCGISSFVMGVIGMLEGINYLSKTPEEFKDTYIDAKKEWF